MHYHSRTVIREYVKYRSVNLCAASYFFPLSHLFSHCSVYSDSPWSYLHFLPLVQSDLFFPHAFPHAWIKDVPEAQIRFLDLECDVRLQERYVSWRPWIFIACQDYALWRASPINYTPASIFNPIYSFCPIATNSLLTFLRKRKIFSSCLCDACNTIDNKFWFVKFVAVRGENFASHLHQFH